MRSEEFMAVMKMMVGFGTVSEMLVSTNITQCQNPKDHHHQEVTEGWKQLH
jgi:hypothetical protein